MPVFNYPYGYHEDSATLIAHDFCKQTVEPGTKPKYPDGVVGIYADDDFWIVANLPYTDYASKSVQEIVAELWPDITDATFLPDHTEE